MARADLYTAWKADEDKDHPRAFELYLELAELGQPVAQQNVAVMFVTGQGVKRDNVLGLAWAKIAAENGVKEAQQIVDQLQPHVTAGARQRIDEVYSRFGPAALQARLLPIELRAGKPPRCRFTQPANPDDYYPQGGLNGSISAEVIVDFTVQPDGRAHTANIVESTTPLLFDEAARGVVMNSVFSVPVENGAARTCDMRIKVKFKALGSNKSVPDAIEENLPDIRAKAEAGDPQAQYAYSLVLLKHPSLNVPSEPIMPWALKAAQAGIADAQYFVGSHTLHGMTVQKDQAKGRTWLRLAARSGQPQAQVMLAVDLMSSGADTDLAVASGLLENAVKSGYFGANYPLAGLLASASDPSLRDPKRAIDLIVEVLPVVKFDPVPHEIRAAAYAWLDKFDFAVTQQKVALARAKRLGWDTAPLEARLALYENNKAWTGNLIAN